MLDFLLLKTARIFAFVFRHIQQILLVRLLSGTRSVVWELTYSEPNAVKAFVTLMNMMFPKNHPALKKLILLVNNGKNGNFEVYVIAAIHKEHWTEVSEAVNNIPGVMQTYMAAPEALLSLAIQGHYYMASSNVTPNTVDALYGKKQLS